MTGNKEATNWNAKKGILDIFDLKEELQLIARQLRIPYEETPFTEQHPLLEAAIAVYSGQEVMGVFGKVKPAIADAFDLRQDVYFAEIFWIKWAGYQQSTVRYQPLSKYPEVKRDLALLLDQQVPYERIKRITMEQGGERLREVALFDVYHDKKLAGKKSYAISMVFRDEEKTLTDKEVETAVSHIMRALEKETGATIRQ
jgi:phenylalanyl-tRNA synthetase beta chain